MLVDQNSENEIHPAEAVSPPQSSSDLSATGLKSKLVLDTRNYFISKIVPGVMGLLTVMVFVRLVGYEQYGRYAILMALVTACATAASGWLNHGVLRFQSLHAEPLQMRTFRRASDIGILLSALLGGVITIAVVRLSSEHSVVGTLTALGLFLPLLIYTVSLTRRQALLESAQVVWMESVRAILSFALPIALIWLTRAGTYLPLLGGVAAGYAIAILLNRQRPLGEEGQATDRTSAVHERALLRKIWNYGWPVAFWFFCQQGLVVSDRYFIRHYHGYAAAGIYASIYDVIVRSFSLIFAPITLSVHTLLMHQWNQGDRKHTVDVLRHAMKYEALIFAPAGIALYFLSGLASRLILGTPNTEASHTIVPLAIGGFLWQFALLAHKPLEILCLTKRMLAGSVAALIINIAGNAVFVPRFGFQASAYVLVASACCYILLLWPLTPMCLFQGAISQSRVSSKFRIRSEEVGI